MVAIVAGLVPPEIPSARAAVRVSLLIAWLAVDASAAVDFARQIEPLLRKNCQGCHGARLQTGGLRLDHGESALAGGYSGKVIVPGQSGESKLADLISATKTARNPKGLRMPPAGAGLSATEIASVKAWIDEGAQWPASATPLKTVPRPQLRHWAFQPLHKPPVPMVKSGAPRNGVDNFIHARLEQEGIIPSPEAGKITLLRRVTLDLTGLLPTLEEVDRFVADPRADAYQTAVDRLLRSPHYGEKWARHWLDLARYADSDGHENDRVRPHAWRYRQWVIDALNRDMGFDEFTIAQIAGDLLPRGGQAFVGTGFHRNTLINREAGTSLEQVRFEQILDRTNTVATVWLGLGFGCAQCHDHKYDPITQKDYYRLFAFFNSTANVDLDAPMPGELGPYLRSRANYENKRRALLNEYRIADRQKEWERRLLEAKANPGKWTDWDHHYSRVTLWVDNGETILVTPPAERLPQQAEDLTAFFIAQYGEVTSKKEYDDLKFKELAGKLNQLNEAFPALSRAQAIRQDPVARQSHVYLRGEADAPGIEVEPGLPSFLTSGAEGKKADRLALAQWLVSKENPLTARVFVNRIWQEYFGRGLVRTAEDFGTQGEKPSHPELLDWLAARLIDSGWSMKELHRTIVTSATYRQASTSRPELETRDPENRLLARQSRLRLPAELIRDTALAASGLLDPAVGGRSVRPFQPSGAIIYNNALAWKESEGRDRYRRGLYVHLQRSLPYPQLINFDAPDSRMAMCRRTRSNTPLQALNLLNDPVFFEAAQALAARTLMESGGVSFADRMEYAFRLCLARKPTGRESERLLTAYQQQRELFRADPAAATKAAPAVAAGQVDPAEAAAWTGMASVLLNLDEFITRE
ncbi:MAG: DUF1553 domain-containing protein [Acidobacteria bacterium]|nr:DUF1553 domain-containing protein [Acidobacteriota bacterium]